MPTFEDRPWYGSSRQGEWRCRPGDDEGSLWKSCKERAKAVAVPAHRGLVRIDSGWEYSVFRDGYEVEKVPAGRFPEVGTAMYISNARENYNKLRRYVDPRFVAETSFEAPSLIRQEWLPNEVNWTAVDMLELCEGLLKLLDAEDWLPDVDLCENSIPRAKNILTNGRGVPKIMDFTAYYDVFRLNEERMRKEIDEKGRRIRELMKRLR